MFSRFLACRHVSCYTSNITSRLKYIFALRRGRAWLPLQPRTVQGLLWSGASFCIGSKMGRSVPKAGIQIDILNDPDFIMLMKHEHGLKAFGVFVTLLVCAKVQRNGGVFDCYEVLSDVTRIKIDDIKLAVDVIRQSCIKVASNPWLTWSDSCLIIRSFEKWNDGWGGARNKAGRPKEDGSAMPEKETDSSQNRSEIKSVLSQKSSRSRARNQVDCALTVSDTVTVTDTKKNSSSTDVDGASETIRRRNVYPEDFESFYIHYPRKVAKAAALKAWRKLSQAERQGAQGVVQEFARHWTRATMRYCVHPATWLNEGRWDDDPAEWRMMARGDKAQGTGRGRDDEHEARREKLEKF